MTTYNAYLDGKKVKEGITKSPFSIDGLTADTAYRLTMTELNADGIESIQSEPPVTFKTVARVDVIWASSADYKPFIKAGDTVEVNPIIIPTNSFNKEWQLEVLEGSEFVSVDGHSMTGLGEGVAKLAVAIQNPQADYDKLPFTVTVVTEEVPITGITNTLTMSSAINEPAVVTPDFTPENTTQRDFKVEIVEGNGKVEGKRIYGFEKGIIKYKVTSTANPEVNYTQDLSVHDLPNEVYFKSPINEDTLNVSDGEVKLELGFLPEGSTTSYDYFVVTSSDPAVLKASYTPETKEFTLTPLKAGDVELNVSSPNLEPLSRTITLHVK